MPILLDTESRSRCDLKQVGGRLYWEHPSTEMLCAVLYDTDSGEIETWQPGEPRPALVDRGVLGAHNMMGFDRFGLARVGWRPLDNAGDADLVDTSELARRGGLPGALDALGARWLDRRKDKIASKFTKGLSSVRRPSGKKSPNAIAPELWRTYSKAAKRELGALPRYGETEAARVLAYCVSDVEILAYGWDALEGYADMGRENDVSRVERAINDRGVLFDSQLAKRLLECDAKIAADVCAEAAARLGMSASEARAIAKSPEQFCAFTGSENAQKETIEAMLLGECRDERAFVMAHVRDALASIARGKLEAGLARVSLDGRLRDSHRYYGAHTGRWSGRGMQLQNMPRPAKRFEKWGDAEICALVDRVLAGAWADAEEIVVLLRACLYARPGHALISCDFSGVEARALAWCAQDAGALAVFASGVSPYKVMAGQIFGVPAAEIGKGDPRYTIGKIAELACGYGMGGKKFAWTARKGGSDLDALGVDPFAVVSAWRTLHRPIVQFWYAIEQAFGEAVCGDAGECDRFAFVPSDDGKDVAMFLPSGRPVVYNDTRVGRDDRGRPRLAYVGNKGVEHTYGGKIVENAIQAMCRDLLAESLIAVENDGLDPVLDVHDDITCEVPANAAPEAYEYLHEKMITLPDWAEGFPIGAEGHYGRRLRK